MKLTHKFLVFLASCGALTGIANASTVLADALDTITFETSTGALLDNTFSASIGYLDTVAYDENNYADVSANFVSVGSIAFPYANNPSYNGFFAGAVNFVNDTIAGENIFLFVTDGATHWVLMEYLSAQFIADGETVNTSSVSVAPSTIGNFTITGGSYNGTDQQVTLAAIPEPSAALLGGLGGLLLLRRRRNKA